MDGFTLGNALWAAGFLGDVALFCVLVGRGRSRTFPVFTSLIAFQTVKAILLYLILAHGSPHQYFVLYWSTAFIDYLFQVALIFEIARIMLRPTGTWIRDARLAFLRWGAMGLLLAGVVAFRLGAPGAKGLDLWEERLTVFTSLLTCELFAAMIVAANRLGLQWRSHVVALSQGLTLWAVVALSSDVLHVIAGWNQNFAVYDAIRGLAYVGALSFWTVSFWLPERERAPLSAGMEAYLLALHRRVQYDLDNVQRR